MPDTHMPRCKAHPSLLLIEPDTSVYAQRAAQLEKAHFCVTRASNSRDVYLMRTAFRFSIAILSDMVGHLALRASAEIVRSQWPKARILILGEVPDGFDDHLYDEIVLHTSDEVALVAMVEKITEGPRDQGGYGLAAWLDFASVAPPLPPSQAFQESDTRKMSGTPRTADYTKDVPAEKRFRQAMR